MAAEGSGTPHLRPRIAARLHGRPARTGLCPDGAWAARPPRDLSERPVAPCRPGDGTDDLGGLARDRIHGGFLRPRPHADAGGGQRRFGGPARLERADGGVQHRTDRGGTPVGDPPGDTGIRHLPGLAGGGCGPLGARRSADRLGDGPTHRRDRLRQLRPAQALRSPWHRANGLPGRVGQQHGHGRGAGRACRPDARTGGSCLPGCHDRDGGDGGPQRGPPGPAGSASPHHVRAGPSS